MSLLSVLTGVAVLSSCKKEKEIAHVGQVTLDQTTLKMVEGTTAQLVATVLPAEAADKTLEWSSTDAAVATVDADGLISALKPGTAVIKATAKDGGIAASCTVKVIPTNCVSINGEEAQGYQVGALETLLQGKTVTSLAWEAGSLDADDVAALHNHCYSTATSIDIRNVRFIPSDKTYHITELDETFKIKSSTELPSGIFSYFSLLNSLQLPAVTSIGESAIIHTSLTSLTLPEGLEVVQDYGIAKNSKLTTMNFPSTLTDAYQSAFQNNSALEGTMDFSHFKFIREQLCEGCTKVTKIILGAVLQSVEGTAFTGMSSLQSIEFTGENAYYKTMGSWMTSKDGTIVYFVPMAGENASGIVFVPSGVKEIRKNVFYDYNLTNIILPNGFESFPQMYALGQYKGQEVTLPSTLKSMHYLTFGYSKTLKKVTVLAVTPPTILGSTEHAFHHCDALTEILVPSGSVDAYKAADGWKAHASIIKAIPTE